MFHDVTVKVKFTPEGKPLWGVSIGEALGLGETLSEAASWAASSYGAAIASGERAPATVDSSEFFNLDAGGTPKKDPRILREADGDDVSKGMLIRDDSE